jgi:ABC-type multidrug transport system ATPase subunit
MESLDLMKMKNIAVKELGEFAKARLSLGIAMIGKTETILLDEPTRELTNKEKKAFWELLNKVLGKRGLIFTTKDEDELKEARKSVYLHGGKIVR